MLLLFEADQRAEALHRSRHALALREFNSYRNLVSCCLECNSWKGAHPATDFLRWLYRQDRLTAVELTQRFRALKRLATGKLRPRIS